MRRLALLLAALLAALLAFSADPVSAQEEPCDVIAPQVAEAALYSRFAASHMCRAGLPALWRGVPGQAEQVMRFTFSSGHSFFWRSVTIIRMPDGSGSVEVHGGGHEAPSVRSRWTDIRPVRHQLATAEMDAIVALADEAGAFAFDVGTWDRLDNENGEMEIFLHCQLLEMERADAAGYRFSSVNIGCNHPNRLMPLVDEVIRLADIGMVRSNWAGYLPAR